MAAAAFFETPLTLLAEETGFRVHLRGRNEAGLNRQIAAQKIWAIYFVVSDDHGLAVGDSLSIALSPASEIDATVIWSGPQILGCKLARPADPENLLKASFEADVTEGDASNDDDLDFGARFLKFRLARKLTQARLAEQLGVSVPAICNWEKNKSRPKARRMEFVASVLGVSLPELLGHSEMPSLRRIILDSRQEVANAAGISPDRVEISIKL